MCTSSGQFAGVANDLVLHIGLAQAPRSPLSSAACSMGLPRSPAPPLSPSDTPAPQAEYAALTASPHHSTSVFMGLCERELHCRPLSVLPGVISAAYQLQGASEHSSGSFSHGWGQERSGMHHAVQLSAWRFVRLGHPLSGELELNDELMAAHKAQARLMRRQEHVTRPQHPS